MHLHVDHPAPRHARPLFLVSKSHDDGFNSFKCCSRHISVSRPPPFGARPVSSKTVRIIFMDFAPAPRFQGARPGYVFKHGPSGVGYYMENGNATGDRPARGGSGNFLEHLEAVEARDVASPGFRPPVNNRTPEWARVQQEGLTEARISYGAHLLPGNGMYDGQKVTQHGNGLGAGGQMEERRRSIHSSQISFADPAPTNGNQRWQTSSSMYQRGGGVLGNAAAHAMPPAGGRSNLAGPSTSYGTQNPASLTSVF